MCVFFLSSLLFSSFLHVRYINKTHNAQFPKKTEQFRLHNESNGLEKKNRVVNRISKIFPVTPSTSSSTESESQRPNDNFLMQSNGIENG